MLALSTCWKPLDIHTADSLPSVLNACEIEAVELEYRIDEKTFHSLRDALQRSSIRVVSLHNVFPRPMAWKGDEDKHFLLSSPDRELRREAIKWTRKTLEWAHELEAPRIVLHGGQVAVTARMDTIRSLVREERMAEMEGAAFMAREMEALQKKKAPYLDALLFSMDRLLGVADQLNVTLALENRYHYYELPGPEDFDIIFNEFSGAPLGYWHDVGHAHALETLGLITATAQLQRLKSHLIGFHLHDAQGLDDHLPPGSGEIDLASLRPYIEPGHPLVVELKPGTPDPQVLEGVRYLRSIGF